MTTDELKNEAEEYLRKQTQLNGGGLFHCNILNLILGFAEPREKRIAELEKENAELKSGCGMCYRKDKEQLTKAKEIIKKFSKFVNNEIEYDPEHPQEHTDLWNELCKEAEQFLSEVEK